MCRRRTTRDRSDGCPPPARLPNRRAARLPATRRTARMPATSPERQSPSARSAPRHRTTPRRRTVLRRQPRLRSLRGGTTKRGANGGLRSPLRRTRHGSANRRLHESKISSSIAASSAVWSVRASHDSTVRASLSEHTPSKYALSRALSTFLYIFFPFASILKTHGRRQLRNRYTNFSQEKACCGKGTLRSLKSLKTLKMRGTFPLRRQIFSADVQFGTFSVSLF